MTCIGVQYLPVFEYNSYLDISSLDVPYVKKSVGLDDSKLQFLGKLNIYLILS